MIVGSTKVNFDELRHYIGKPLELVAYAESLVPTWARHMKPLLGNQRYYLALHVRKMLTLSYQQRKVMTDALTNGIKLHGNLSEFVSITEIVQSCDLEVLSIMLRDYYERHKS